jgi:hypothetical protein
MVFTRWTNKKDMSFLNFSKKAHGLSVYQSTQFSHLECFKQQYKYTNWQCSQVFYSTLYTSKSTQEEYSEKQLRIGHAVMKRIQRLLNDQSLGGTSKKQGNKVTLCVSDLRLRLGYCKCMRYQSLVPSR